MSTRDMILISVGVIAIVMMFLAPAPEARSTGRLSVEQQQHINLVNNINERDL